MLAAADVLAWLLAILGTVALRLGLDVDKISWGGLIGLMVVTAGIQLGGGLATGVYQGRYRVASYDEVIGTVRLWTLVAVVTVALDFSVFRRPIPTSSAIAGTVFAIGLMLGVRLIWRTYIEWGSRPDPEGRHRVVVFGAGEAGHSIVRAMQSDPASRYVPVALLDDDPNKARRQTMGVKVVGTLDDLADAVVDYNADMVLIAIPAAGSHLIGKVYDATKQARVEVRTLPAPGELIAGVGLGDIRPITENDLLGRSEVEVDLDSICGYITGRRVLVTGAGGSIGSELCRQLHTLAPSELIMLDRDETGLHGVQLSIEGRALLDTPNLVVADIRDRERIFEVFELWKPEVVFHAAALKHLTLLENHPSEGHKTNVVGTKNVIEAAVEVDAEYVVNVSTDKAADPTSVLGATKLLAEQLTADLAGRTGRNLTSVRFGNVLGSRGSVLPTFREQIARGGPVTVTDAEATRYFMTIPEAVRLVLQAGAIGRPGETMILDMGEPVKILDMAQRLIDHLDPTVRIEITGLRPAEKLHEALVSEHEVGTVRDHPRVLHAECELRAFDDEALDQLGQLDDDALRTTLMLRPISEV
ncbi:MAG: polysaccharide biosynthesis protein [Actinomycetia bacterium]|nr:polysaccharide biosynthesis protein [Actinomycetes bacterium]